MVERYLAQLGRLGAEPVYMTLSIRTFASLAWRLRGRPTGYAGRGIYCEPPVSWSSPPSLSVRTVLDQDGKDAFQRYLDAGGNFIGSESLCRDLGGRTYGCGLVHGASACLFNTGFYNKTIGACYGSAVGRD